MSARLDPERLPRHVAIIMDGNGRWAKSKGWLRLRGHEQGAETVRMVTTESARLGIKRLTLYAFSTENWSRPALEVEALMRLLDRFLVGELQTLIDNGVRLQAIGQVHRLPQDVRLTLDRTISATASQNRMILSLALSYGGRDELVDACRAVAGRVAAGEMRASDISADTIQAHLYAGRCPYGADDVDLVIRSAGEQRLSNFLPWQANYAEYIAAESLWPDFTVADYHGCLAEYQRRERRFGRV